MILKKVGAEHNNNKKKIITIELKKKIIENYERSACSELSKPIRPKHINNVHFFCFKNPKKRFLGVFRGLEQINYISMNFNSKN